MKDMKKNIDKKSLIIAGVFLVSIVIILFGGALIYNKFFYKKTYSEVETIMLEAAKSHFKKNEEKLPQNINDTITLTDNSLVKAEEMDSIASYLKDENTTCEGEVTVTNINGDYRYTSILDCGEDVYQTKKFMDYVTENINVVTSGNGLYELNNELVYRGDDVDNYIKLGDVTYRIVKYKDGNPVVIYTEKEYSYVWDDRYNIERDDTSGINNYEVSRIKEYLNTLYEETSFLSKENKLLVIQHSLAIGKRSNADTDKSGSLENSKTLDGEYIGLLPMSDYLNASLDANCIESDSPSCTNYNYLSKYKYNWWTMTGNSKNTYKAYRISGNGSADATMTNGNGYVRPVLYLASDTVYVSGDGSKNNPFIVR